MVASLMPARSSLAMSSAQVDSSHCSGFQSPPKTKRPLKTLRTSWPLKMRPQTKRQKKKPRWSWNRHWHQPSYTNTRRSNCR